MVLISKCPDHAQKLHSRMHKHENVLFFLQQIMIHSHKNEAFLKWRYDKNNE